MTAGGLEPATESERAVQGLLTRASLYRLLGQAFAYPGPERLQAVAVLAAALAQGAPEALGGALAGLARAATEADPAAVATEYVFLFDRGARCPPYESAWGEATGLAGKPALLADIAGFYGAFGLSPAETQPDLEDHIAAECEFMSALAVKEAWALAEGHAEGREVTRRAAASFLGDHLGRWAEAFAEGLRGATPLAYYGALGALTAAWISADVQALGAVPLRAQGPACPDPIEQEDAFTCPMAQPQPPAGAPGFEGSRRAGGPTEGTAGAPAPGRSGR